MTEIEGEERERTQRRGAGVLNNGLGGLGKEGIDSKEARKRPKNWKRKGAHIADAFTFSKTAGSKKKNNLS